MTSQEILRGSHDSLDEIDKRHTPITVIADKSDEVSVEFCTRCEQLWPCDSHQLARVIQAIGRKHCPTCRCWDLP